MQRSKSLRPDADIYALVDPTTGETHYIGLAVDLAKRLRDHLWGCRHRNTLKDIWLRSLKGARPVVQVLETVPRSDMCDRERFWIACYRNLGAPLTNMTAGGESMAGWSPSEETRAKIGASNKGRKASPEQRAKLAAIVRARGAHSAEWRANQSAGMRGKPKSEEHRRRMSEVRRGKVRGPLSEEHKAKLSAVQKGRIVAPERRAKLSEAGLKAWREGRHRPGVRRHLS